jgi:hypothetical protein
MQSARYNTLVGEGCPAPDVEEAAKNRKIRKGSLAVSCRSKPERVRNVQKNWHTVGTANDILVPSMFRSLP